MQIYHIVGPAPLFTNTFLAVDDAGTAVAVDPAAPVQEYLLGLEKHGAKLAAILLTHGHHDHVGTVAALKESTGAPVYMGREDAQGTRLLPLRPGQVEHDLADGDMLTFGQMTFRVLRTPGHSAGSVCYLCDDVLFSGDTLFAGDIGRTDLDNSDPAAMEATMRKLWAAFSGGEDVQVLPGHGEFSQMREELAHNYYLRTYGAQ